MSTDRKFDQSYRYVPDFLPCVKSIAKDGTSLEPIRITHPLVVELIRMLAKARPHWEFVGVRYRSEFHVWAGNTHLGVINFSLNTGTYLIDCESLSEVRRRGSYNKTKNIDKACKLILDNFKVKPDTKVAHEKHLLFANIRRNAKDTAYMKHKSRMTYLASALEELFFSDVDKYTAILIEQGLGPSVMLSAIETKDEVNNWDHLYLPGTQATPVVIVNDVYHLPDGKSYTDDTLPVYLRQNLGLLKLAPKDTTIRDVGYKVQADMFLVVQTKGDET